MQIFMTYANKFWKSPSFVPDVFFFQVAFALSDALAKKEDGNINKKEDKDSSKKDDNTNNEVQDKVSVPREYKMLLSKVEQSMGVFSEGPAG